MQGDKLRIVFFGTPEFAVGSLDRLVKGGENIVGVVTMPDKKAGRGQKVTESDVKRYAMEHNLKVLQPQNLKDPEFLKELEDLRADLFIVIAFRMLPEAVWQMPPKGTFNLHASLLPRYRGAAPINHALINGDKKTGVTTFFLKHEIDTGDIISRKEIEIDDNDNAGSLHDKLMALGAEMVASTVRDITAGEVKASPQPEGEFKPAPKIFKEDCRIDWNLPSAAIHNLVRGLSPYPAAWTKYKDEKTGDKLNDIKVFETAVNYPSAVTKSNDMVPGTVVKEKQKLFVVTADGFVEILSLQPAGKKRMDTDSFLRGYSPVFFV